MLTAYIIIYYPINAMLTHGQVEYLIIELVVKYLACGEGQIHQAPLVLLCKLLLTKLNQDKKNNVCFQASTWQSLETS